MTDTTPRLALPLLQAGQAQKELFHNEALAGIDALLHAMAETLGDATPPAAPSPGQAWIVGAGASGAWAGQDGRLACWTAGGWRFPPVPEGALVWVRGLGVHARATGGAWTIGQVAARGVYVGGVQVVGPRTAAIAAPMGGATVDAEARATLSDILKCLISHGLIAAS